MSDFLKQLKEKAETYAKNQERVERVHLREEVKKQIKETVQTAVDFFPDAVTWSSSLESLRQKAQSEDKLADTLVAQQVLNLISYQNSLLEKNGLPPLDENQINSILRTAVKEQEGPDL